MYATQASCSRDDEKVVLVCVGELWEFQLQRQSCRGDQHIAQRLCRVDNLNRAL
jgi:hypothetical protein